MSSDPVQTPLAYDTFHMGRSCMELYCNDVGAAFVDIKSFAAYDRPGRSGRRGILFLFDLNVI
jgi:hypothetical protein